MSIDIHESVWINGNSREIISPNFESSVITMFKYNNTTLKKLEAILKDSGYIIRYERGQFNSGYCVLESKQVIVINRFYDLEAKINVLVELVGRLPIQRELLDENSLSFYDKVATQNATS